VLLRPVMGMTAVGTDADDGMVTLIVAFGPPAPTMLAVTFDRLNEFRFCINTPN
jgi:hypothetical protein